MIFNSWTFFLFLPIVFTLHWSARTQKSRNLILLASSYVFYGWWDYRFLSLIIISSVIDFIVGIKIDSAVERHVKKRWLWVSLGLNLGMLGYFKYHAFFVNSLAEALSAHGIALGFTAATIILPVGISFYTFQTLSYSIDIFRGTLKPTKDLIAFLTFVSFFPQLVAGPIERAAHLLPKFYKKIDFNYDWAVFGARLILWGLVKKVLVADMASYDVDSIFRHPDRFGGWPLYQGLVLFAFQIYCDFSAYSDIARGVSFWFGIDLVKNFNKPYLATSFRDFWARWHISLSTWFRDYVYIPLGGSRMGHLRELRNLAITFVLSGLWHGANWTFVIWGALHSIYYVPEKWARKAGLKVSKAVKQIVVFHAVLIAWAFFRSPTVSEAFFYIEKMFSEILLHPLSIQFVRNFESIPFVVCFFLIEIAMKDREHPFDIKQDVLRWGSYLLSSAAVLWFMAYHTGSTFIYFQF